MNFSNTFTRRGPTKLSPCGTKIASIYDNQLVIYNSVEFKNLQQCSFRETITSLKWAPNSQLLLLLPKSKTYILVKEALTERKAVKIQLSPLGCTDADFCPDSSHIVVTLDFNLSIIFFSITGQWMEEWQLLCQYCLSWCPNEYTIMIHSSSLYNQLQVVLPQGKVLFYYQPYTAALGMREALWSPTGNLLAIASFDQVVRIVNTVVSKMIAEFEHTDMIYPQPNQSIFIERQISTTPIHNDKGNIGKQKILMQPNSHRLDHHFVMETEPVKLKYRPADMTKPNPRQGISQIKWSFDGKYLASCNENTPHVLWIWNILEMELEAVFICKANIKVIHWNPCCTQLAFVTGSEYLFLWNSKDAVSVPLPFSGFQAQSCAWPLEEKGPLLLTDKSQFCIVMNE
ncbi:WD repeat-containing protein WRAP73 [Galdieria sulphuraria]|nr:WD repeat-containing protein WRAP73 [Galdieria sulphuraria]